MSAEGDIRRNFDDQWIMKYPVLAYRTLKHNQLSLINFVQPKSNQIIVDFGDNDIKSFVQGSRIVDEDTTIISGVQGDSFLKTNIQLLVEHGGKLYLAALRFFPYHEEDDWLQDGYVYLVAGNVPMPEGHSKSKVRSAQ